MPTVAINKRARFDFDILETFEAGLSLHGFEVKSVRAGRASIVGAHAIIRGEEAYLVGLQIPPYQPDNTPEWYDPSRTRKLLLRKAEIRSLIGKTNEKGLTITPIRVYTKHGLLKVELGLARGKKKEDKRQKIKERDAKRKIERHLKQEHR
jgi:SsrA-binding protein